METFWRMIEGERDRDSERVRKREKERGIMEKLIHL